MTAEILAVGTELLLGDIINTNAQFLSAELARLGVNVLHQSVVGDNTERLSEAFLQALSRSDMVITTGGLGPTGDDITRETVAKVLGLPLELHEPSLENMKRYFTKSGRVMSESNIKQAMLPANALVYSNLWGTAPGCAIEHVGKTVIMLPGPPREMCPMFEKYLKPQLALLSNAVIASINLRVFGVPESDLQTRLDDLMQGENPTLSPYAKDGEVLLRITARAPNEHDALLLCRPIADEVIRRLGSFVYGENVEGLAQTLVEELKRSGRKLALAESCTGGLVAKLITDRPGSSQVFNCGVVSYSNDIKHSLLGVKKETLQTYGAVSKQTACEMATGIKRLAEADFGVGITGIAGPDGGTAEKPVGLVFIAVADATTIYSRRLILGHGTNEREYIRYLTALNALDIVRRINGKLTQNEGTDFLALEENQAGGLV